MADITGLIAGGQIQVLRPTGTQLLVFSDPASGFTYAAVPEPGAVLAVALGVGARIRRRLRTVTAGGETGLAG